MLNGNVGPPIPGGNADLLGDVVDAVDGPALIAASDDQSARDARNGFGDYLNQERFPFSRDGCGVDFSCANQSVNKGAFANRANNDRAWSDAISVARHRWMAAGHSRDVVLEIFDGSDYTNIIVGINVK